MKKEKDYNHNIVLHMNQLHEALNSSPCDYNRRNIEEKLASLTYDIICHIADADWECSETKLTKD